MSLLSLARRRNQTMTAKEAARFLRQIFLTVRYDEIVEATGKTPQQVWNEQVVIPAQQSVFSMAQKRGPAGYELTWDPYLNARIGAIDYKWFVHPDKLRNRIVYALSEYFVISSAVTDNFTAREAMSNFYDILYNNVYGNFRTLLEQVSRSIEMSIMLTHFRNRKEDPVTGRMPDENYAREIMQLFTIGLWELNDDNTRKKNGQLDPSDPRYVSGGTADVPTYGQNDITNMARVFTGMCLRNKNNVLGFNNVTATSRFSEDSYIAYGGPSEVPLNYWATPLEFDNTQHEMSQAKVLLNGRINIPVGTNGDTSLAMALDGLFNHPCTPPFFCSRMIRLLVTSNPSPAYISRVVSVFKNDGNGVRGNLAAVFKAIFLDQEARAPADKNLISRTTDHAQHRLMLAGTYPGIPNNTNGALTATGAGTYPGNRASDYNRIGWWTFYQSSAFHRAGSVFGRFPTLYSPPNSAVSQAGKLAPELFHYEEGGVDHMYFNGGGTLEALANNSMSAQDYTDLPANRMAVINRLSLLLTAGTAPQAYLDTISAWINSNAFYTQDDAQKRSTFRTIAWQLWMSPWAVVRT